MYATAKQLVGDGADILALGCAGMMKLKPAVEDVVGSDVQVVDRVLAGVHHLVGMVRMGAVAAKKGMYMYSCGKGAEESGLLLVHLGSRSQIKGAGEIRRRLRSGFGLWVAP
ncbi:hypothetical protein K432DRAFT_444181 [Lepidopterella palustris CBS 459.81]|uniref:Uncharacterized protein n=1 Tax=Lepidopterella palustris CBS 459.81 TaxID=1314670 RepID=A0A8E2E814_9PEZI|nr:hypothetical protein K432DRAFT_444181 [Lepidopterella palustris CBS 459.81]